MTNIKDIKWRVNIVISSRDLSRVLEPVVYLELWLTDGSTKCLEIPVSKFHTLRQNVALLLKEIDVINRKGTNIMRIIGPSN
nr:COMM domain-containing protein 5-like [Halyomorpha halys]